MTEVQPILTDKAAEEAFLIGMNTRLAALCMENAEDCAKRLAVLRGPSAFICRLYGRKWLKRRAALLVKIERVRLGL